MRRLILMRHAQADDQFKGNDESRPLTFEGMEIHEKVADQLKNRVNCIDGILFSPFLRAKQSAEIVRKKYPEAKFLSEPALGNVFDSYTILQHLENNHLKNALIVGHAPSLQAFGRSLICEPKALKFDKSGALILDFKDDITFGQGYLVDCISPNQVK